MPTDVGPHTLETLVGAQYAALDAALAALKCPSTHDELAFDNLVARARDDVRYAMTRLDAWWRAGKAQP